MSELYEPIPEESDVPILDQLVWAFSSLCGPKKRRQYYKSETASETNAFIIVKCSSENVFLH